MKKIKNTILVLSIALIFVINMTALFAKEQGVNINLSQLLNLSSAKANIIDPNDHYGYIWNITDRCCKSRYHDDVCKGILC